MSMTAEQVVELKKKLRAELARRNGVGSVAEFAGEEYEFSTTPKAGQPITEEQGRKIIDLLLKICDYKDLKYVVRGDSIPEAFDAELLDLVDKLSAEQKTGRPDEKTSCNGECTGLCTGSCVGLCNGCTSCTGMQGALVHGTNGVKGGKLQ